MYVDDVLAGYHTTRETIKARNKLFLGLGTADFSLRKFTSSSQHVKSDLPPDYLLHEEF